MKELLENFKLNEFLRNLGFTQVRRTNRWKKGKLIITVKENRNFREKTVTLDREADNPLYVDEIGRYTVIQYGEVKLTALINLTNAVQKEFQMLKNVLNQVHVKCIKDFYVGNLKTMQEGDFYLLHESTAIQLEKQGYVEIQRG